MTKTCPHCGKKNEAQAGIVRCVKCNKEFQVVVRR
jgi:ribosomal protein L37AE/L43A